MAHAFSPGYSNEPFATLVQEYPAEDVLPPTAGPLSPAGAATSPLGNGKSRLDALPHVQAQRTGCDANTTRATITTTVPFPARPWLTTGPEPGTEDPAPGPPAGPGTRPDAGRSAAHEETRHGA